MSSSAETKQETDIKEQGERDSCKLLSQELVAGKKKGWGQCWQSCVDQQLPEILDCWLA